jgi:predicted Zn finger-like uncharacterized protein
MYTQCPDCSTAFRVTADILKKAAGKVRCGGCGNAFNALDYLSETMPEQPPAKEAEEALPELKPEPLQHTESLPISISAEQSAALLKTLDELAGSDIRIEDTGVEWRVLAEDEIGQAAADEPPIEQHGAEEPLEESPTVVEELRFDDNTGFPDDLDLDDQLSASPKPVEKLATELPVEPDEPEDETEEESQGDLDLSEPDEWTELLGEFDELVVAVAGSGEAETQIEETAENEPDTVIADTGDGEDAEPEDAESIDELLDVDTQFALQAEAMGIDLTGGHEAPSFEDVDDEEETTAEVADDADETELDDDAEVEPEADIEEEEPTAEIADETDLAEPDDESDFETEAEVEEETTAEVADDADETELDDDAGAEPEADIEEEPTADAADEADHPELDGAADVEPEAGDFARPGLCDDEGDRKELYVPPLTEEEQTINMQIDQDLLALAIEDEDGFASTIVVAEDAATEKALGEKPGDDHAVAELTDTGTGFETIIMEGEFVRSALDKEKFAADAAAAVAALAEAAAAERDAAKAGHEKRSYGMIGGAVLLVLLLAAQALHQSRDALATIPAFNNVVGPMYRAIGKPLSPEWDITGWRFEATKGSTDESDERLSIFSRIGNKSDQPLPYPLIGISLTDRFEETIGSRILDPAEYLPDDIDPHKLVQPGNTFNAVVTIESAVEGATGFKLNVCYRESGGQLRCAIDDFK